MKKIVVTDGFDKNLFTQLCADDRFDTHPESKVSAEELDKLLPTVNAMVIRSATTITPELLEKAPNLKLVIRAGEGTDNIDKVACGEKGVIVENTPGANNNSAAEHAISLALTALRKTAWAHKRMSEGGWDKSKFLGNELAFKKVGVVGFGRIGQLFAKRLTGFEPDIMFFDPFVESTEIPYTRKASDLKELFSTCDIISVHVPLNDHTKGLVSREMLESMQPGAVLVNASRGGVTDEEALLDVLQNKKIRAAAFDVFASEPLAEDHPFRKLDNLVMTPHIGASTEEAQLRVGEMVIHQIKEFFIDNNLINEVKA